MNLRSSRTADPHRTRSMLWILGPAGVGKSAIAQTIGERCKNDGRGAAFFFSRLGHRDNPLQTIPTLAYQLAVRNPSYKHINTERLATTLLQFKELTIGPFKGLKEQGGLTPQQPLVIIIDRLDECNGGEPQCELIELISECTNVINNLLWIVSSRPEWHFRRMLSRAGFGVRCRREDLSTGGREARKDIYMFLKDGFEEIRQRYSNVLTLAANGHQKHTPGLFIFASTIVIYVGDRAYGTPDVNLNNCLDFIRDISVSAATNSFHALDLLYHQILSEIPSQLLPTVTRIFGLCILYDAEGLTVWEICNSLGIDCGSFYSVTTALPAILYVPDESQATEAGVMFYHASFGDFLKDPRRSGDFFLNEHEARVDITTYLLRWHNFFNNENCTLTGKRDCLVEQPQLSWVGSKGSSGWFGGLKRFCEGSCWNSFRYLRNAGAPPDSMAEIDQLRFRHLESDVYAFASWLQSNHPAARPLAKNLGSRFIAKVLSNGSGIPPVRNWAANKIDRVLERTWGK